MAILTSTIVAIGAVAAVGGGAAAYMSNSAKRKASDQRNKANAAREKQAVSVSGKQSTPAAGSTGSGAATRPKGRNIKQSRTNYTSSLGLSTAQRSQATTKTLTGQ